MRCEACGSETPPHYQHIAAWICHTCKALGKIIKHHEEAPIPPQDVETHDAVASTQEVESTEEPTQEPVSSESTASADSSKRKAVKK